MTTWDGNESTDARADGGGTLLGSGLIAGVVLLATIDFGAGITAESGAVEAATVAILAFGAMLAFLRGAGWTGAALALLAMRELDWDKAFLAEGILKTRLYVGDAPAVDKAIGAAVVGFALLALWRLASGGGRGLLAGLRQGDAWAWCVAAAGPTVVLAKTLDGIGRKMLDLGVVLGARLEAQAVHLEEWLELGFAGLLCAAVLAYRA